MVLTDFGLCKECVEPEETTSTFCGTPEVRGGPMEKTGHKWLTPQPLNKATRLQQRGLTPSSQALPRVSPKLSAHFLISVKEPAFGTVGTQLPLVNSTAAQVGMGKLLLNVGLHACNPKHLGMGTGRSGV